MTTAVNHKTRLDAIVIGHFQGGDTFPFLEKRGIHFFQKMSTAPLFFSAKENEVARTPSLALSSLPFCTSVQFSCNSIHAFNDRIKIRTNRGLLKVYDQSVGVTKKALLPQKSYQEESGTRSEPSSFSIIAAETGNNRINVGVNCYITLLVISELKVKNGMLINLHLKKCLTTSLCPSQGNFVSYSKCKNSTELLEQH